MRATISAGVVGLALLLSSGCGGASGAKTPIDLKDVPENIMKIAREQLPDVAFDTARRKANGSIEVMGKAKNGKIREIDIRADGSIEEIE